jgi:hypothetical protein
MPKHEVYKCIVRAVKSGELKEPFSTGDFQKACPGFGIGTYRAFLYKHSVGNSKTTELFAKVSPGKFKLVRPLRYGIDC